MSQSLAKTIESFWPRYLADLLHFRVSMEALHQNASVACTDCTDFAPDSMESSVVGMANRIVTTLVRTASTTFTAPGCKPLSISHSDYQKRFTQPLIDSCDDADVLVVFERFSPVAVWDALESEYGGEIGSNIIYSEAAVSLVREFGLHRESPSVSARGFTLLDITVWSEDRHGSEVRLGYNSRERMRTLCGALHVLAQYSDRADLLQGVDTFRQWSQDWKSSFHSRQRVSLACDLIIVMYQSRFEFQLGPDLTRALQVFVSLYAADLFKERA